MRFGWLVVAICALIGPSLAVLLIRDPTETIRAAGMHVRGAERKEWLRSATKLQAEMSEGLGLGEFNSGRGEIAAAAAFSVLMEKMPAGSEFAKENTELQKSLKRTSEIWKQSIPDYPRVCNLKENLGWREKYCGKLVIDLVREEGLDLDPEQVAAGGVPLDNIVSAMLTSNSMRLERVVEQFR